MSSKYISSSQLFSSHPGTDQRFSFPRSSSQLVSAVLHARKLLLSERSLLHKKPLDTESFLHTEAWDTGAFTQKSLYKILCTTKPAQNTFQYYFALQSLDSALHRLHTVLSITLYYKGLRSVLLSLHKALPSTTLYYKACTNHFPKLAPSISTHFVLQSLHKALSSSTLYYKACTLVLQSLHTACPSTTLYYTGCTNIPVHSTESFYTSRNFYTQQAFTHRRFYTEKLLHFTQREGFTHRNHRKLYAQQAFTQRKLLHKESFELLRRDAFTQRKLLRREVHTTLHDVLLCDVKSHTTLHDVLLCDIKSLE